MEISGGGDYWIVTMLFVLPFLHFGLLHVSVSMTLCCAEEPTTSSLLLLLPSPDTVIVNYCSFCC